MLRKDDAEGEKDDVDASSASVIWHKTNLIGYLNVSIEIDKLRHFCGWCLHNCVCGKRGNKTEIYMPCMDCNENRILNRREVLGLQVSSVFHFIGKQQKNGSTMAIITPHTLPHSHAYALDVRKSRVLGKNDQIEWKRNKNTHSKYTRTQIYGFNEWTTLILALQKAE